MTKLRRSCNKKLHAIVARVCQNDPELTAVDLDEAHLGGKLEALFSALAFNTHVTELRLRGNGITDELVAVLAAALEQNASIAHVSLGRNKIGTRGAVCLEDILSYNTSLVTLDLQQNDIDEEMLRNIDAQLFPRKEKARAFGALLERVRNDDPTVSAVSLDEHMIGNQGVKLLCEALANNSFVTHVSLRDSGIGDAGAESISSLIKQNRTITSLKLGENEIGTEGVAYLAPALASNVAITDIGLETNQIDEEGVKLLDAAMRKNESLEQIDLSGNLMENRELILDRVILDHSNAQEVQLTVEPSAFDNDEFVNDYDWTPLCAEDTKPNTSSSSQDQHIQEDPSKGKKRRFSLVNSAKPAASLTDSSRQGLHIQEDPSKENHCGFFMVDSARNMGNESDKAPNPQDACSFVSTTSGLSQFDFDGSCKWEPFKSNVFKETQDEGTVTKSNVFKEAYEEATVTTFDETRSNPLTNQTTGASIASISSVSSNFSQVFQEICISSGANNEKMSKVDTQRCHQENSHLAKAIKYISRQNCRKASLHFVKSMKLHQEQARWDNSQDDPLHVSSVGLMYCYKKQSDLAIECYEEVLVRERGVNMPRSVERGDKMLRSVLRDVQKIKDNSDDVSCSSSADVMQMSQERQDVLMCVGMVLLLKHAYGCAFPLPNKTKKISQPLVDALQIELSCFLCHALGNLFYKQRKYKKALNYFQLQILVNDKSGRCNQGTTVLSLKRMGRAYHKLGAVEQSIHAFNEAQRIIASNLIKQY